MQEDMQFHGDFAKSALQKKLTQGIKERFKTYQSSQAVTKENLSKNAQVKFNARSLEEREADDQHNSVVKEQVGEVKVDIKKGFTPLSKETIDQWHKKKADLLHQDVEQSFSFDTELTDIDVVVDRKLEKLRNKMLIDDPVICTEPYYDKLKKLMDSDIYTCFKHMPKPAVHHTHFSTSVDVDFLVSLTYNDFVYYSQKEDLFFVNQKGCSLPGYLPVNVLRQYSENAHNFDDRIRDMVRLKTPSIEDHKIWKDFQHKFMLTNQLYNYSSFFSKILRRILHSYIEEMVFIVEFRHVFGCLFDDDGPVSLEREMQLFDEAVKMVQMQYPLFRMKIIVCGLKLVGADHIQAMLDACEQADKIEASLQTGYHLISGFDMINEEDYNEPIDNFLEQIIRTKTKMGDKFQLYLHAGESNNRNNKELYDAVLLGSKRIAHGLTLSRHKALTKLVKDKDICVECCPISNRMMGYCADLRTHPVRGLLAQGVKVSISPGHPGLWDAKGVTLDYVMVYIAWGLDLSDIKQLLINSIDYASVTKEHKEQLKEFFEYKWYKFLLYVKGRH